MSAATASVFCAALPLMSETEERAAIAAAMSLAATDYRPPADWVGKAGIRRVSGPAILISEHGCFIYDADSYADDLPFWVRGQKGARLVVPHTFTHNDNRLPSGKIGTGPEFSEHLMSAFRVLYAEGAYQPRMMTVSLHNRISGQPSRFEGIARLLDEISRHPDVWIASRGDVARHWMKTHPCKVAAL